MRNLNSLYCKNKKKEKQKKNKTKQSKTNTLIVWEHGIEIYHGSNPFSKKKKKDVTGNPEAERGWDCVKSYNQTI